MFEFGRELKRIFRNSGKADTDASLYELMNLKLLIAQGRILDVESGRMTTSNRFAPALEAAQIWREYARRTGDPVALRRATTAAEAAGREARDVNEAAAAAMEQARVCLQSYDLFGTADLLPSAERLIADCRAGHDHSEETVRNLSRIEALLAARVAHHHGIATDLDLALDAMARIERCIEVADEAVRQSGSGGDKITAAQLRYERADLLLRVGIDRGDPSLCEAVIKDFQAVRLRLDPVSEPVTYAGVTLRLARALMAKGHIEGRPDTISEGIALLNDEATLIEYEHSPLDWTIQMLSVAQGMVTLGELVPNDEIFSKAEALYTLVGRRPLQMGLVVRADMLDQQAVCTLRQAEAKDKLAGLDRAQTHLKNQIRLSKPHEDPVSWAVLQLNLARLYVIRGDLDGVMRERLEAVYAADAALDIFREQGLSELAEAAQTLMGRVAGDSTIL